MKEQDLSKQSLAELAIGQSVNMDLAAAILQGGHVEELKRRCRQSVYWPEFCRRVAQSLVADDFAGPGIISRCVIDWARESS